MSYNGKIASAEMTAFRRLFRIALLAIALASESIASALPTHELHATHRAFEVAPDLSIEAFHPPSSFEVRCAVFNPLSTYN